MSLDYLTIETAPNPDACIIWLHGLGADGHDFEPIVPELQLPPQLRLRFLFPHAPVRPVTINGGMAMRAWYDIDPRAPLAGTSDIEASAQQVATLIAAQQAQGIASTRILLAGFSQGGVIALHLGLRYPEPLAGIMALSTYVHDHESLAGALSFANLEIPIFMAHGLADPMIPITRAVTSREVLRQLNFQLTWHEYSMGHSVCPEEIRDISQWLQQRFQR